VVQHGGRVPAEPCGDLLVRHAGRGGGFGEPVQVGRGRLQFSRKNSAFRYKIGNVRRDRN